MKKQNGISLIALIITIVVMIIIALVVVGASVDIVPRAMQARFMSNFSTYREAVVGTCTEHNFLFLQQSKADKQIYYEVASGATTSSVDDIVPAGTVSTLEIKDYLVGELSGEEYYEIIPTAQIVGYEGDRELIYSEDEKFYITDEGEVFTLPGFMDTTEDEPKYWITTDVYYTGTLVNTDPTPEGGNPEGGNPEGGDPEGEEPDEDGYVEVAPDADIFYNGDSLKINGEEFKLIGDLATMEFQKNGDGYTMGMQLSKGDAFTYGNETFFIATDAAAYVPNDKRDEITSHTSIVSLNLEKGLTIPSTATEVGDLALKNGKVHVYIGNPYYMPPDGSGYTYESWWVELNEVPNFEWR